MENRTFNFFRFEDLRLYHKTIDYVHWVTSTVKTFPENASFFSQSFIKASTTITINIAEGSGRNKSQFIYYLKMAKSSIRECIVLSTISLNEGLINQDQHEESKNFLIEISKMTGALISSLQRSKPNDVEEEDLDDPMPADDPNLF